MSDKAQMRLVTRSKSQRVERGSVYRKRCGACALIIEAVHGHIYRSRIKGAQARELKDTTWALSIVVDNTKSTSVRGL